MSVRKGLSLGRVLSDDGGTVRLTQKEIDLLVAAGVSVVRVELRLGSAHHTWDATILANYRTALGLLAGAGISVIALVAASAVAGATQDQWNQNNIENTPLSVPVTNPFIDRYVLALATIALSLGDLVWAYEIWNEPNCYSTRLGTVYSGATYLYPSLYATLLPRSSALLQALSPSVTVLSGGLFAHNIGGGISRASSGATYLEALCTQLRRAGAGMTAPWPWSSVGYHVYLDQGSAFDPGHLTTYLGYIAASLALFAVPETQKGIVVTEAGWTTRAVLPEAQATNLTALYAACASAATVSTACWFLLTDNTAAGLFYGLCSDLPLAVPKPAYTAYQALTSGGAP